MTDQQLYLAMLQGINEELRGINSRLDGLSEERVREAHTHGVLSARVDEIERCRNIQEESHRSTRLMVTGCLFASGLSLIGYIATLIIRLGTSHQVMK